MRRSLVSFLLLAALAASATAATSSSVDPAADNCRYGIALAVSGRLDAAEDAFVRVLGLHPWDTRALTNLGNLYLLRGKPDVARMFYASGAARDTLDPGIRLDEATAHFVSGDRTAALKAIRRAAESGQSLGALELLIGLGPTQEVRTPLLASPVVSRRLRMHELFREAAADVGGNAATGQSSHSTDRPLSSEVPTAFELYWKR